MGEKKLILDRDVRALALQTRQRAVAKIEPRTTPIGGRVRPDSLRLGGGHSGGQRRRRGVQPSIQ